MAVKVLADLWLILAVVLHVVTLILVVTSLAAPYWMDGPTAHFGLWNYCYEHDSATYSAKCYSVNDVSSINVDGILQPLL